MKWYIALSASSLGSPDHDWPSLIKAAIRSAGLRTKLRPHLLWDGPALPFLDELRGLGATVIFHRTSVFDALEAYNPWPQYLQIASGCFLRADIPMIECDDEFVLYTDADVIFLDDPAPRLEAIKPKYFAGTGEFTFEDELNSGVLWLNVAAMRRDHAAFTAFIRDNLTLGLDQDMYRAFYRGRFERLPPALNWKPYWGRDGQAVILHWHGIKPVIARRLLADPGAHTHPDLARLVQLDPGSYRYYLHEMDRLMASEPVAAPSNLAVLAAEPPYELPAGRLAEHDPGQVHPPDWTLPLKLISCAPLPLYENGGFYGPARELAWLQDNTDDAAIIRVKEIYPASSYVRKPPLAILTKHAAFRHNLLSYYENLNQQNQATPSTQLVMINGATVFKNVIYLEQPNRVIYETYRDNDRGYVPLIDQAVVTHQAPRDPNVIDLFIGSAGSSNYGHWLTDDLPRLRAAIDLDYGGAATIRVWMTSYQAPIDQVRADGIGLLAPQSGRIEPAFFGQQYAMKFSRLYYVTPCSYHPTLKNPGALEFAASTFNERTGSNRSDKNQEKIFIGRSAKHGRSLLNEEQIKSFLASRGFKTVDTESLSFREQSEMFAKARIIIGCMGAAMTNTIFAPSGSFVVYLAPAGWLEPYYWDLASLRRHHYIACYGPTSDAGVQPHLAAFSVELDLVDYALQIIG